jgi:hypothetical protein
MDDSDDPGSGSMDLDILSHSGDEEEDEGPLAAPDDLETPPPLLTIGNVLDTLPKIKSGREIASHDYDCLHNILYFQSLLPILTV